MSNLEHLIENGLSTLKRGVSYEKWLKTMKNDVNWQGNENISIEQLWVICQYVIYTWIPSAQPERKKGKWVDTGSGEQCSVCGEIQYGYDNYRFYCGFCGADMRGERDDSISD